MGLGSLLGLAEEAEHKKGGGLVYERHKAETIAAISEVVDYLRQICETFDKYPDSDEALDAAMPRVGELLRAADMKLGRFRATRDCDGSA